MWCRASLSGLIPCLLLALLGAYATALGAGSPIADRPEHSMAPAAPPETSACATQHGSAAYVCCDGEGGFTVCRGRGGGDTLLNRCIDRHEEDHLAWFNEHLPQACAARPRGACRFEMSGEQLRELECSGYRTEVQCLTRSRGLAGGRRRGVAPLLARQRQLVAQAADRFACSIGDG